MYSLPRLHLVYSLPPLDTVYSLLGTAPVTLSSCGTSLPAQPVYSRSLSSPSAPEYSLLLPPPPLHLCTPPPVLHLVLSPPVQHLWTLSLWTPSSPHDCTWCTLVSVCKLLLLSPAVCTPVSYFSPPRLHLCTPSPPSGTCLPSPPSALWNSLFLPDTSLLPLHLCTLSNLSTVCHLLYMLIPPSHQCTTHAPSATCYSTPPSAPVYSLHSVCTCGRTSPVHLTPLSSVLHLCTLSSDCTCVPSLPRPGHLCTLSPVQPLCTLSPVCHPVYSLLLCTLGLSTSLTPLSCTSDLHLCTLSFLCHLCTLSTVSPVYFSPPVAPAPDVLPHPRLAPVSTLVVPLPICTLYSLSPPSAPVYSSPPSGTCGPLSTLHTVSSIRLHQCTLASVLHLCTSLPRPAPVVLSLCPPSALCSLHPHSPPSDTCGTLSSSVCTSDFSPPDKTLSSVMHLCTPLLRLQPVYSSPPSAPEYSLPRLHLCTLSPRLHLCISLPTVCTSGTLYLPDTSTLRLHLIYLWYSLPRLHLCNSLLRLPCDSLPPDNLSPPSCTCVTLSPSAPVFSLPTVCTCVHSPPVCTCVLTSPDLHLCTLSPTAPVDSLLLLYTSLLRLCTLYSLLRLSTLCTLSPDCNLVTLSPVLHLELYSLPPSATWCTLSLRLHLRDSLASLTPPLLRLHLVALLPSATCVLSSPV
uniref:Uncharacterized protein n=1 Tax=Knipowitschia caucasica TaxID=637954 RepID=A0AAV2JTR1_KNICA